MRSRPTSPHLLTNSLLLAFVVLSCDLAVKWYIHQIIMQPPQTITLTSFFNLVMHWNRGVSFGLLYHEYDYMPYLLSALAMVIVAALLVWLWRTHDRMLAYGLGAVIGGAIGNVVDRLLYGAVRDFFDFHVAGWHWPAFNIADSAIVIGVGLILLDGLVKKPESR
jgi:signal peptidase II